MRTASLPFGCVLRSHPVTHVLARQRCRENQGNRSRWSQRFTGHPALLIGLFRVKAGYPALLIELFLLKAGYPALLTGLFRQAGYPALLIGLFRAQGRISSLAARMEARPGPFRCLERLT